jgi:hypothetical protein
VFELEWRDHRRDNSFCRGIDVGRLADPRLRKRELIAPEPAHEITIARQGLQSVGCRTDQFIADMVPQLVVYFLEPVEIDVVECDEPSAALGGEGFFQFVKKRVAIERPRHGIMVGEVVKVVYGLQFFPVVPREQRSACEQYRDDDQGRNGNCQRYHLAAFFRPGKIRLDQLADLHHGTDISQLPILLRGVLIRIVARHACFAGHAVRHRDAQ